MHRVVLASQSTASSLWNEKSKGESPSRAVGSTPIASACILSCTGDGHWSCKVELLGSPISGREEGPATGYDTYSSFAERGVIGGSGIVCWMTGGGCWGGDIGRGTSATTSAWGGAYIPAARTIRSSNGMVCSRSEPEALDCTAPEGARLVEHRLGAPPCDEGGCDAWAEGSYVCAAFPFSEDDAGLLGGDVQEKPDAGRGTWIGGGASRRKRCDQRDCGGSRVDDDGPATCDGVLGNPSS